MTNFHAPVVDRRLIFYTDGGFSKRKFPLSPAYGSRIYVEEIYLEGFTKPQMKWGEQIYINHPTEIKTTQMSEVATLKWTLEFIRENFMHEKEIIIRMDSRFALNSVQGNYKLKCKHLVPLVKETVQVKDHCPHIIFEWISGIDMKGILGH